MRVTATALSDLALSVGVVDCLRDHSVRRARTYSPVVIEPTGNPTPRRPVLSTPPTPENEQRFT